ncbi:MAG: hypothetical protein M3R08_00305, partial [Bacteroidota bacterium]|nr:hypothetical protein [Bacteroidota bacterium]
MRIPLILTIMLAVTLTSCRRESNADPSPDRDHTSALDAQQAESFFADALRQSDIAYKDGADGSNCIQSVTID